MNRRRFGKLIAAFVAALPFGVTKADAIERARAKVIELTGAIEPASDIAKKFIQDVTNARSPLPRGYFVLWLPDSRSVIVTNQHLGFAITPPGYSDGLYKQVVRECLPRLIEETNKQFGGPL